MFEMEETFVLKVDFSTLGADLGTIFAIVPIGKYGALTSIINECDGHLRTSDPLVQSQTYVVRT